MEITISARHFTATEEMKQRITDAIQSRFTGLSMKFISAKVILTVENDVRATAELVVNAKEHVYESHNADRDVMKAFDVSLDKVAVQVNKYIDKKQSHH